LNYVIVLVNEQDLGYLFHLFQNMG
jgi:hypothetical protein